MKFKDLQGKIHSKNLSQYKREKGQKSRSIGQGKLGDILCDIWPNVPIYEEVPCAGTKLRLDYLIESLRIAFEFDGTQHQQYNPFLHGDRYRWLQSIQRDDTKDKWCQINNITLIRIVDKDLSMESIRKIINERHDK